MDLLLIIRISPGTNVARFYRESTLLTGGGWRNVWSRSTPAKAYEGIHSFSVRSYPSYQRGETLVTRLGKTQTTTDADEDEPKPVVITSRYILGPQEQILHRLIDEKGKPSTMSMLLPLILKPEAEE